MSADPIKIRMAEYDVIEAPGSLVTIGLGSCVGIALHDPRSELGGMIHVMLPENKKGLKPAKYADTGLPLLVDEMEEKGAKRSRLVAKIAGGAAMFSISDNSSLNVGERNVEKVRQILKDMDVEIAGEDVGKDYGRTMKFFVESGEVVVSSHKEGEITL